MDETETIGGDWYRDPEGRHDFRWHDGAEWTQHVANGNRFAEEAPTVDRLPPPAGEAVWLPHPATLSGRRLGPVAASRPSYGFESVPEGGYAPVATKNTLLDFPQNYINEFESSMRRNSSLLVSTWAAVREIPLLWPVAVFGAAASVGVLGGVAAAAYTIGRGWLERGSSTLPIVLAATMFAAYFALYAMLQGVALVVYSAGVSAGLDAISGSKPRLSSIFQGAWRAKSALLRLFLARLARLIPLGTTPGLLYEAGAVFAVPAAVEREIDYHESQRQSEELVLNRWGPGRFRALGVPRMPPWAYVYTRSRFRYGFKGPFLVALAVLAPILILVLAPFVVAQITTSPRTVLLTLAICWGGLLAAAIVWGVGVAPLFHGVLRAYLYGYAVTGNAQPPYLAPALHACLREEARAKLSLPQRRPEDIESRWREGRGLPGSAGAAVGGGLPYLEYESGVDSSKLGELLRAAWRIRGDAAKALSLIRGTGAAGLDASGLRGVMGLSEERCRNAVATLVFEAKVRPHLEPDGKTTYRLA